MFRKSAFITVVGASLVLALPATGLAKGRIVEAPQWQQALEARSEGLNKQHGLGQYASKTNVQPPMDVFERAVASANSGGRGVVFDNYRASAPVGEGRQLVFDNYRNAQPTSSSTPISVTGSGREIEWPQVGVGLGIGIMLMIGLYLAVKSTRQRPLAH